MQGPILRKYGVETTLNFPLYEVDGVDLKTDAVHALGDTTIMEEEGAEVSTDNGFVDRGKGYSLTLTASELSNARLVVYVSDQTPTKTWLDTALVIETYGHADAQHAFDLDKSTQNVNIVQISGDANAAANLEADYDGTGYNKPNSTIGTCTTNTDMRGTDNASRCRGIH